MYLFITPPQDNKWEQLGNKEKRGNIVELENKKEATQWANKIQLVKTHTHTHVNNLLNIN